MVDIEDRVQILISDLEEDDAIVASFHISSINITCINYCILKTDTSPQYDPDFEIKEVGDILDRATDNGLVPWLARDRTGYNIYRF